MHRAPTKDCERDNESQTRMTQPASVSSSTTWVSQTFIQERIGIHRGLHSDTTVGRCLAVRTMLSAEDSGPSHGIQSRKNLCKKGIILRKFAKATPKNPVRLCSQ